MDTRAFENVLRSFSEFKAEYLHQAPPPSGEIAFPNTRYVAIITCGKYTLFLEPQSLKKYEKLWTKWYRAPWRDTLSEEFIEKNFKRAIGDAWDANDKGVDAFTKLEETLTTSIERFTVWLPLVGVDLQLPELQIGTVKIIRFTAERANDLITRVERIIDRIKNPDDQKVHYRQITRREIESLIDRTLFEVQTQGDDEHARLQAEKQAQTITDVLQTFCGAFLPTSRRVRVHFSSFEASGYRPVLMLADDNSHYVPSHRLHGAMGTFELTEDRISSLKEWKLFDVADILSKLESERTETERFIVQAFHWFADGELQSGPENRLLSYVTCLDMFFSSRGGEATSAIQDGVAYFLGRTPEHRIEIHEFIGRVYDHRSRASHEGMQIEISAEIEHLRRLALNFIAEILQRRDKLPNKKTIKEWVFQQRMA